MMTVADRAVVRCGIAHVPGGSEQLGMGVAHIVPGHRPAPKVAQDGPAGQRVVGVPAHRGSVSVAFGSGYRFAPPRKIWDANGN